MIHFNDGRTLFFSGDKEGVGGDDTTTAYLNLLAKATKSVHIADYSFNLPQLVPTLGKLHSAGLEIKLVLDRTQSAGNTEKPIVKDLQDMGLDIVIGTSEYHKIMHNKFTIIDSQIAQYGSWNYTAAASDENNFFFIDPNPEIAEAFDSEFIAMYNWIKANEAQIKQGTVT